MLQPSPILPFPSVPPLFHLIFNLHPISAFTSCISHLVEFICPIPAHPCASRSFRPSHPSSRHFPGSISISTAHLHLFPASHPQRYIRKIEIGKWGSASSSAGLKKIICNISLHSSHPSRSVLSVLVLLSSHAANAAIAAVAAVHEFICYICLASLLRYATALQVA